MDDQVTGNYLRMHRRKAGLSQRELGRLLGYKRSWQISRHERSQTAPPLLIALAYQQVFRTPVSAIFAGMAATVEQAVEENVVEFEKGLQEKDATGRAANEVAQKLTWITNRKSMAD